MILPWIFMLYFLSIVWSKLSQIVWFCYTGTQNIYFYLYKFEVVGLFKTYLSEEDYLTHLTRSSFLYPYIYPLTFMTLAKMLLLMVKVMLKKPYFWFWHGSIGVSPQQSHQIKMNSFVKINCCQLCKYNNHSLHSAIQFNDSEF